MKILYAVQATGNGHICRAQKLVPALRQFADVDVLTSGTAADISLGFPVKYHYRALVLFLESKEVFNGHKPFLETTPFAYAST